MMLAGANRVQNERMMNMCRQNSCSNVTALVVSVIAGIGLAVIFSLGIIANVTVALWIAFGLSIVSLLALFAIAPFSGSDELPTLQRCFCAYSKGLIAGTIGTLVTTLAALSLTIAVTSTALIIIFFLIGLFLALLLISIVQFLWCLTSRNCCRHFRSHEE